MKNLTEAIYEFECDLQVIAEEDENRNTKN